MRLRARSRSREVRIDDLLPSFGETGHHSHPVRPWEDDALARLTRAETRARVRGEGWHNNHHAFPRSARHGLRWWELDLTYGLIRLLALVGLAGQIQVPGRALRQAADCGVLTGGHILPG
jgi:hypothetical protein